LKHVVVIGAGLGGLSAAIRLKKLGHEVVVLEKNEYPGGKCSSFSLGNYRFDAGPSLFTLPHLVTETLELADNPVEFPFVKLDRSCHYFWNDGTQLIAWFDKEKLAQEISSQLGVDPSPTLKHLEHSKKIYEATSKLFLEKSLHKLSTYFSKDVLKAMASLPQLALGKSMNEVNQDGLNHPKLVQLFNRYATYNGSNPFVAPGVLHTIPHLEHNIGTFLPMNGMVQISNALHQTAINLGVKFHFNTAVSSIETGDKMVKSVVAGDQSFSADIVVSNADVYPTYRHLLPNEKAPEKTLHRERSSSALIFYWGVNKIFDALHVHNIFFSDNYKAEFEWLFEGADAPDDLTVYINITSGFCKDDAPANGANWFVMVNAPANDGSNNLDIPAVRRKVIAKLSAILKTDIEPLIEEESFLDPVKIESQTGSFMGSLYGTSSNDRMSAFLRHPNFTRSIDGLYFCGGSVHPGGGIPLCLLSGKIVADLIKNRFE
jgi:diapolycopene oxygenase